MVVVAGVTLSAISMGAVVAVTVSEVDPLVPEYVALMVVAPAEMAVASPVGLMVATDVLELAHVAVVLTF